MKKAIFKMSVDCGRMGVLEGVFVERKDIGLYLINNPIHLYFGEVLGKHSEVQGTLDEGELIMVTDDDNFVELFEKYELESGHNPFDCEYQDDDRDVDTVKEYIIKILTSS